MASSVYRDNEDDVRSRLAEADVAWNRESARCGAVLRPILVRRGGRIAAGYAGIGGGVVLFGKAVFSWHGSLSSTGVLVGAWLAMGVAYVVGRVVEASRIAAREKPTSGPFVHPRDALESLMMRRRPRALFAKLLAQSEASSIGLPLAALALLMPLTLHWFAWQRIPGLGLLPNTDFDEWIRLSAFSTGLAHVYLAVRAIYFGRELSWTKRGAESAFASWKGWSALGCTTLVSLLPGAILLFIPPVVTLLTGLLFIPVTFWLAGARLRSERTAIAMLDDDLAESASLDQGIP